MQVYKVIPSNPNVIMVRNTLAVYGGLTVDTRDVGTLCQAANNKWSKYKPVRLGEPLHTTDWWRDASGYCGLDIKKYRTMALMYSALRAGTPQWDYLKPRGLAHMEYFRLQDYIGYDVDATPPYSITTLKDTYYIGTDYLDAVLSVKTSNPGGLLLSDLGYAFNLAEMYLGLSFVRTGQTNYAYLTSTNVASNPSGALVSTPTTGMAAGTYEVSLFFAEFSKLLTAPDIANTFIPIPESFQTVEIRSGVLGVYFGGGTYWKLGKVYFQIIFNNTTNQGQTLNKCYIDIKYGDNIDGPSQVGEVGFEIHTNGQPDGIVYAPANTKTIISVDYPVSGVSNPVLGALTDFDPRGGYIKFTNSTNDAYDTGVLLYEVL